jgi:cytoskeletal protein RodZ
MPEETKTEEPEKTPKQAKSKKLSKNALLMLLLVILLLAGNGALAWQYKKASDDKKQADKKSAQLSSQVDNLTKELAEAKQSTAQSSGSTSNTTCSIPSATKENVEAAITSKNTAALQGYMASQVNVVFAASEKGGKVSAAQAVTDLDYVNSNGESPWDFSLSSATLDSYKAGFYKQYFEEPAIVGKASNGLVVVFHFNKDCKIDMVFVAANAELLT